MAGIAEQSRYIILPGLTEVHAHLREPGATHKEDFSTGSRAAIAGGITTVLDMPNNPVPTVSEEALKNKINLTRGRIYADVGFHFGATEESSYVFGAVENKIFGYKVYMNPTTGNLLVDTEEADVVFAMTPRSKVIIAHAEGETLNTAIGFAEKYRKRLHVAHVSTAGEVNAIREAKERGKTRITSEAAPHHFYLTENDIPHLEMPSFGIMKPPLGRESDVLALREGMRTGVIDIVATDHAPHTREEKESDKPPFGVPGLETSLPLMLNLAAQGVIPFEKIKTLMYDNPRIIFAIPEQEDTYIYVDPEAKYTIDGSKLQTKAGWTPFDGMRVQGKIVSVTLRGQKVFDGEQVVGKPGGRVALPRR